MAFWVAMKYGCEGGSDRIFGVQLPEISMNEIERKECVDDS